MAENSRDSRRRRRILEQGSDRLAFIKGRIQSLPSGPEPNDPNTTETTDLVHGHSDAVVVEELNHDSHVTNPYHSDDSKSVTQTQPLPPNEAQSEISSLQTRESEPEQVQPPPPDISMQRPPQQAQYNKPKHFIIPTEISSAINASRVTRLCCSVAVAILVVASYLGFSLLGTPLIKTLVSFRPLYLVLATNSTVVVARILSGKQRDTDTRQNRTSDDANQWDIAGTLELGLVMQSVVDALFMDCAVYAIVVICGLSLVQA